MSSSTVEKREGTPDVSRRLNKEGVVKEVSLFLLKFFVLAYSFTQERKRTFSTILYCMISFHRDPYSLNNYLKVLK